MDLIFLETYVEYYRTEITKKEHVLVVFVHWFLVRNEFLCIGTLVNDELGEPVGSELLPPGWRNEAIKYIRNQGEDVKLHVLQFFFTGKTAVFTLCSPESLKAASVIFIIDEIIMKLDGRVKEIIGKKVDTLNKMHKFVKPFIYELDDGNPKELVAVRQSPSSLLNKEETKAYRTKDGHVKLSFRTRILTLWKKIKRRGIL